TPIMTVGDTPINSPDYQMVGVPDGLGAFDNGDGTFTLLMNHELLTTEGVARDHGGTGSFVSIYVINKADLSVISGHDLIQTIYDGATGQQLTGSALNLGRLCSADLPDPTAFYNPATGKGTQTVIFMDGEEVAGGRAFAHIVSGPNAGTSYTLPVFPGASF